MPQEFGSHEGAGLWVERGPKASLHTDLRRYRGFPNRVSGVPRTAEHRVYRDLVASKGCGPGSRPSATSAQFVDCPIERTAANCAAGTTCSVELACRDFVFASAEGANDARRLGPVLILPLAPTHLRSTVGDSIRLVGFGRARAGCLQTKKAVRRMGLRANGLSKFGDCLSCRTQLERGSWRASPVRRSV